MTQPLNKQRALGRPAVRDGRRKGAAMIEFSLAFVMFMTMTMAVVELGRAMWVFTTLAQAAGAGVRYATVHGSGNPVLNNGVDETAQAVALRVKRNSPGLDASQMTVNTVWVPNNDPGSTFELTVSYPMEVIFGRFFFSQNQLTIQHHSSGVVLN